MLNRPQSKKKVNVMTRHLGYIMIFNVNNISYLLCESRLLMDFHHFAQCTARIFECRAHVSVWIILLLCIECGLVSGFTTDGKCKRSGLIVLFGVLLHIIRLG